MQEQQIPLSKEEIICKEWDSTTEDFQLAITLNPAAEKIGNVMDEYAKQQAIEFWKFCIEHDCHLTLAADEIYNTFLQSQLNK